MTPGTIGVFGKKEDRQAQAFCDAVRRCGGSPLLFDLAFGTSSRSPLVSMGPQKLKWDGVDLTPIRAVYLRALAPNTLPAEPPLMNPYMAATWRANYIREQQIQACTYSFFDMLGECGCLVVNRPSTYRHHNSKAQFYERLRAQGFAVPRSLTTSDPQAAHSFIASHGRVVAKPGIGVGSTRILTEKDRSRLEEVAYAPILFQEFIEGPTLRVHVVGRTVVLALKILSEEIDSRTDTEGFGFEYFRLPDEEARRIGEATASLEMHFAAWDVKWTAEGRCVYLDANPGPFLLWIGPQFVEAVFDRLAKFLLVYAETRDLAEAEASVSPWSPSTGVT